MKKCICLILIAMMTLFLAVPASAASYSVSDPKWVTIDGKITQDEWGKPIYKGVTLQQAEEGKVDDILTAWWFDTTNNVDTSFDLYLTHNDKSVFVGCVIRNVDPETSTDAKTWQQMNFTFTLSDYKEGTDVSHVTYKGEEYEYYTGYRIYVDVRGKLNAQCLTQGMEKRTLYAGVDYQAVYNTKERTMTYEVEIPYSYTKIDLEKTPEITLSAVVALNHYGNSATGLRDGSNRFLVGTGANYCGGAENFAHKGQCIRIKLASPEKVQENTPEGTISGTPTPDYTKNIETEIAAEPEYRVITANQTVLTPLIIILASIVVVILCAVVITIALVRDRNKKAAAAVAAAQAAEGKDGEDA